MKRLVSLVALAVVVGAGSLLLAAESPVGKWKTVDHKTGKVVSEVEVYEQGGKLFGKIVGLTEPNDKQGKPKTTARDRKGQADRRPRDHP
jgi:hypothetical protein